MLEQSTRKVTTLLDQINGGQAGAFTQLVNVVYPDLRRIAAKAVRSKFQGRVDGLTMQPTEFANEAIMALCKQYSEWQNTEHFFAIATRLIFRLVAQYRRDRSAAKRGGGHRGHALDLGADQGGIDPPDHRDNGRADDDDKAIRALERLHEAYPRQAEVLTLTVICQHEQKSVAEMVGVSVPQVQRDARFAKAWMKDALDEESHR